MTLDDLRPRSYWLPHSIPHLMDSDVTMSAVLGLKSTIRWAVRCGSSCMSKSGTWSLEPIPSSRSDHWLKCHRFLTPEAALDAYEKNGRRNLESAYRVQRIRRAR